MLNSFSKIAANQLNTSKQKILTGVKTNVDIALTPSDPVFLPYQINWLTRKDPICIDEKSRQIGWSYTHAGRAVYRGVVDGISSIYTSYNKDSARQFIKDCAYWAKVYNSVFTMVTNTEVINHRKINVFQLTFNNGETIQATAGDSKNLRAKPGHDIYLDEIAYRDETIEELIAAASATLIWGGTIRCASTHAGLNSDFHNTIKAIHEGKFNYGTSKVTFRNAIADGLYRRRCLKKAEHWTQENENAWVQSIYDQYNIRSSEELDVEPADFSGGGKVFPNNGLRKVNYQINANTVLYRYYDLASSISANAFYSASVLIAHDTLVDLLVILDYDAEQRDPIKAHDAIIGHIIGSDELGIDPDPIDTIHIVEREPGSTSGYYIESIKSACPFNNVVEYRPQISKLKRALPAGAAVAKGELCILDTHKADFFSQTIAKFDGTKKILVNDLADCVSGIFDYIKNGRIL